MILNELVPNELFRFVHVRGPNKAEKQTGFVALVYDTLSPKQRSAASKNAALLYPALAALQDQPDQPAKSQRLVIKYQSGKDFIASPDDYVALYPQLSAFIDWLDVNADVATPGAVAEKFKAIFKAAPKDYAAREPYLNARLKIWDNLFANLFAAREPFLVTLACKYLGTLNLIDLMAKRAAPERTPGAAYRSRPLVPKWFIALAASIDLKPDQGVDDQTPAADNSLQEMRIRYLKLVSTFDEIRRLNHLKREVIAEKQRTADSKSIPIKSIEVLTRKKAAKAKMTALPKLPGRADIPDPFRLDAADLKALSADARGLLTELLGRSSAYELDPVFAAIRRESAALASAIGSRSRKMAIQVAGTVVDAGDFCSKMEDKDPCGQFPRQDFLSRGSFVTGSLIGDLLVTKQQLIKYDLGEVAHVENAMAGLEKERTHRRLHRTEESDLFETESSTETERETQTTDRFDMEKESSKVLEQNFQIDAGVTASGSYGTVNFTSSLDASYGYSSQQSQSDATSFSKSVTTRALSRVKERVRHVKTITVINEIEETSLNKLTNKSDDHINGVYRWLDKFYLNKIINYGKRLMFEFTVPEPGQFYIFRQTAKPRSGDEMSMPADPKELHDPTFGSLNTPSDITFLNYAFWASHYGAAGMEPPPATLYISKAWKNATVYTALTGETFSDAWALPPNYEAIYAYVLPGTLGPGVVVDGTVGTVPFNLNGGLVSLWPVAQSLSITLVSFTAGWTVDVVLQCEPSALLVTQWRNKIYGAVMDAYAARKREYEDWLQAQRDLASDSAIRGNNPAINREIEREELKKRCLEFFTGQRFESFDAAVNGIYNQSGYPEMLFAEAIREGNIVKFFELAFDWPNMTYIFYPYFWGRKPNWLSIKQLEDAGDPLFTKFLQAGYARAVVPVRPGFENYLMMFQWFTNLCAAFGCAWNFQPSMLGMWGVSNAFSPAINDPTYVSISKELEDAAGLTEDSPPPYYGTYVQKVPTSLVYIAQNNHTPGTPWPGLPDNSADLDIAPYL